MWLSSRSSVGSTPVFDIENGMLPLRGTCVGRIECDSDPWLSSSLGPLTGGALDLLYSTISLPEANVG